MNKGIKKPFYKKWWFWLIVVCLLASPFTSESSSESNNTSTSSVISSSSRSAAKSKSFKNSNANNKSSSQKSSKNKNNNYWQKYKAGRLKLGTSKEEVIKKIGKPIDNVDKILVYNDFELYFENDKLVGGTLPAIQKKTNKAIESQKYSARLERENLYSYAQIFGQEPVSELQKSPSYYPSHRLGDSMMYTEIAPNDKQYVRIDDAQGFTTVYLYDPNAENGLGKQLYQGKTLLQPAEKHEDFYVYQNNK